MSSGIFPSIHVNTDDQPFQVVNDSITPKIQYQGRVFFKALDIQGQVIDARLLNRQFDRGCFCPQGFEIVFIHVGYTYISPIVLQKPIEPDLTFTSKQALKLSRPFILGIVIQSISQPSSSIYLEMSMSSDKLLKCVANGSIYGSIKKIHQFASSLWNQDQLNSQFSTKQFHNSAFHTLVPVNNKRIMKLVKSPIYGLDLIDFSIASQGESLVGIAYMTPTDITPVCIYGYPYDISLFVHSIAQVPTSTFYYSQNVFKIIGGAELFVNYIIALIQQGFASNRPIASISEKDYQEIQNNLSLLIQGQVYLYGNTLYGMIDSIVAGLCAQSKFKQKDMCACYAMQYGSSCDFTGTVCRTVGYKNTEHLQKKCIPSSSPIYITQNTQSQTTNILMEDSVIFGQSQA